jgi:hypothetical protein
MSATYSHVSLQALFLSHTQGVKFPIVHSPADVEVLLASTLAHLCELKKTFYYICENFIVQQYVPEFSSEPEKRLFFVEGEFNYAVGHVGAITFGERPRAMNSMQLAEELKAAQLIFKHLPKLGKIPVVRLDFGPHHKLNEIEILPDFFGGPDGLLDGPMFPTLAGNIARAYEHAINKALHTHRVCKTGGVVSALPTLSYAPALAHTHRAA